jgi:pseudouridine/archaeosine synthase-like protein
LGHFFLFVARTHTRPERSDFGENISKLGPRTTDQRLCHIITIGRHVCKSRERVAAKRPQFIIQQEIDFLPPMITLHDSASLLASAPRAQELSLEATGLKSWDVSGSDLPMVELLLCGYCAPLRGFMSRADYEAVLSTMRLTSGQPWPAPVTLGVDKAFADSLRTGERIALRDESGVLLAVLSVSEIWSPDPAKEAQAVFGEVLSVAPTAKERALLAGSIEGVELPTHYDFTPVRFTPHELKSLFGKHGWKSILAFQPEGLLRALRAHTLLRACPSLPAGTGCDIGPSRPVAAHDSTAGDRMAGEAGRDRGSQSPVVRRQASGSM